MSEIEYKESDYRMIGYASIGRHSRASNFVMTEEQRMDFEDAQQALIKALDKFLPSWETINIEIKEKK